jgi:hypothetical protein
VADYVTSRTVDAVTPGSDTPTGTFSANTYPTDAQVTRLIDAACGWILAVTGPVATDLEDTAKNVAALRAAAMVELSYPVRNDEIDQVASVLLAEAQSGRNELVAANRASGVVVVSTVPSPRGSFPDAWPPQLDGPGWDYLR